jgi:hypothetical protein
MFREWRGSPGAGEPCPAPGKALQRQDIPGFLPGEALRNPNKPLQTANPPLQAENKPLQAPEEVL